MCNGLHREDELNLTLWFGILVENLECTDAVKRNVERALHAQKSDRKWRTRARRSRASIVAW